MSSSRASLCCRSSSWARTSWVRPRDPRLWHQSRGGYGSWAGPGGRGEAQRGGLQASGDSSRDPRKDRGTPQVWAVGCWSAVPLVAPVWPGWNGVAWHPSFDSLCFPFSTSPGFWSAKKVSQYFCHLQRL